MTRTVGKSMASGGLLSLVRLATGVIRVKVLALALGASGIGAYSVLLLVYLTAIPIVSMGLAIPIINLGRRHVVAGEFGEAGSIAGTALAIITANGVTVTIAAIFFGQLLFQELGVATVANGLVWPILAATLFGAVSSSFWEGLSYLCDRFDTYVRVGIIAAVVEMLIVALGAWGYGLQGAIIAMPAGPVVMFAAYFLMLRRDAQARQVLRHLSVRLTHLPTLFAYSAMMFAAGVLINAGMTYLRSRVLIEGGAAANGYLQVATSMSAYILSFVTTGFYGHLHARAAATGDTPEVRSELHKALRFGLLVSFTGCGAAAAFAEFLIPLFYSGEFRPAAQIITAYMPAELCYQLLLLLTTYQLTVSHRRRFLAWSVGYVALLMAVGILAIPTLGPFGYVAAHVVASVVMLLVVSFGCWRHGQIRPSLLWMAATLAVCLSVISALLIFSRLYGFEIFVVGAALIPIGITAWMAISELLDREMIPRLKWIR